MKNIQIIDGAVNCVYDIFAATAAEFALIFPDGTDIAFIDEVYAAGKHEQLDSAFSAIWKRPVRKADAAGIHGTIFYELAHKKAYYPTRRDEAAVNPNGTKLRAGGAPLVVRQQEPSPTQLGIHLHDAEIIAIETELNQRNVTIRFRETDGRLRSLACHGVQAFRGEDLALQNVVHYARTFSPGSIEIGEVTRWLRWSASYSSGGSKVSSRRLLEWRQAWEAGRLELLVIEPSGGAQLAVLCEGFNLA